MRVHEATERTPHLLVAKPPARDVVAVYVLEPLSEADLATLLERTGLKADEEARARLLGFADGDARRLFNAGFAQELSRTLTRGGMVNVATDDTGYFTHIQQVMAGSERFATAPPEPLPPEAKTEFESVFVAQGKPIHRTRFVRLD